MLRDGQRIASKSVKQPPSISELGASVVRVLNQLDPQQLSRVVSEADAGLPDPAVVLPNLARASLLLHNTTADFKGQGRELLDNFQVLLQKCGLCRAGTGRSIATAQARRSWDPGGMGRRLGQPDDDDQFRGHPDALVVSASDPEILG